MSLYQDGCDVLGASAQATLKEAQRKRAEAEKRLATARPGYASAPSSGPPALQSVQKKHAEAMRKLDERGLKLPSREAAKAPPASQGISRPALWQVCLGLAVMGGVGYLGWHLLYQKRKKADADEHESLKIAAPSPPKVQVNAAAPAEKKEAA